MPQGEKKAIKGSDLLLFAALLLFTALLYFAAEPTTEAPGDATEAPVSATPAPVPTPSPKLVSSPIHTPDPTPVPTPTPAQTAPVEIPTVTEPAEMMKLYRTAGADAQAEIEAGLAVLREQDPAMGKLWTGLFKEMFYVNQSDPTGEEIPTGLPEDDSLCIVVFGYALGPHGGMRPELKGRCDLALACAEAYPEAYIALTGGATASENRSATEAKAMARYLKEKGVAEERLILEGRSHTSAENAVFLERILTEDYPQIRSLVIVSSDYHVPMCCLLLTETALIDEYLQGNLPYEVVGGVGFPSPARGDFQSPRALTEYVMNVARSMGVARSIGIA